jgi:hypothetical protein
VPKSRQNKPDKQRIIQKESTINERNGPTKRRIITEIREKQCFSQENGGINGLDAVRNA